MTTSIISSDQINTFWDKVPAHITFVEECVKLGHVTEFQSRYALINSDAQAMAPELRVEFNIDMHEAKVSALIITTKSEGKSNTRILAKQIVDACPTEFKDISTYYKLPALDWSNEVTEDWILGFCEQYKMRSIAPEMASAITSAEFRIKQNLITNKVLVQVGMKNAREIKAVGRDTILLLMELLLGEQILCEGIELVSIKTKRKLNGDPKQWLTTGALKMRDAILTAIYKD